MAKGDELEETPASAVRATVGKVGGVEVFVPAGEYAAVLRGDQLVALLGARAVALRGEQTGGAHTRPPRVLGVRHLPAPPCFKLTLPEANGAPLASVRSGAVNRKFVEVFVNPSLGHAVVSGDGEATLLVALLLGVAANDHPLVIGGSR